MAIVEDIGGDRYRVIENGFYKREPLLKNGDIFSYKELLLINESLELDLGRSHEFIKITGD